MVHPVGLRPGGAPSLTAAGLTAAGCHGWLEVGDAPETDGLGAAAEAGADGLASADVPGVGVLLV